MKTRRHHNTKGLRQIKTGKTFKQVKDMARRLTDAQNEDANREMFGEDSTYISPDMGDK